MNWKIAASAIIIVSLISIPTLLNINFVSAQSSGYTIQSVDHIVEVMFSGHIVVRDEIKISGSTANGFQFGIPLEYAVSVLKVVAFDNNRGYPVEIISQLGGQSGFYAAKVNFEGQNPQSFTIEFVLSNNLVSKSAENYCLEYPAYPAFTTSADRCKVALSLPTEPETITIYKSDGQVNSTTYYYQGNLPAYTNIPATAMFDFPAGLLQLIDISTLNRQMAISPSGEVSCVDKYNIKNLDALSMGVFMLNLPSDAKNVVVRDGSGSILSSRTLGVAGSILIVSASFSYITPGQLMQIAAEYTLPSVIGNSHNFTLFPAINYFVDTATFTLTLPEGASFNIDDSSAVITTNGYEQKLTVTRQNVTYVDYQVPGYDFLQINYSYNPLWASFRPTIVVFVLATIGCLSIVIWKKQGPKKEVPVKKKESLKKGKNKRCSSKNLHPLNWSTGLLMLIKKNQFVH
ncbi:MAG: hypothetical protein FWG55_04670 [Candidatus Bathyarchaeota archaeon]|nr:hypothetical protein [Candidatus Termiticorpusculum sp.]